MTATSPVIRHTFISVLFVTPKTSLTKAWRSARKTAEANRPDGSALVLFKSTKVVEEGIVEGRDLVGMGVKAIFFEGVYESSST